VVGLRARWLLLYGEPRFILLLYFPPSPSVPRVIPSTTAPPPPRPHVSRVRALCFLFAMCISADGLPHDIRIRDCPPLCAFRATCTSHRRHYIAYHRCALRPLPSVCYTPHPATAVASAVLAQTRVSRPGRAGAEAKGSRRHAADDGAQGERPWRPRLTARCRHTRGQPHVWEGKGEAARRCECSCCVHTMPALYRGVRVRDVIAACCALPAFTASVTSLAGTSIVGTHEVLPFRVPLLSAPLPPSHWSRCMRAAFCYTALPFVVVSVGLSLASLRTSVALLGDVACALPVWRRHTSSPHGVVGHRHCVNRSLPEYGRTLVP